MRVSIIGQVRIFSAQLSSIVQFGDSVGISASSRVLAVQREKANFWGSEGDLGRFRIFSQNIPQPLADEPYSFRTENEDAAICVGDVTIYGLSASTVFQAGSNRSIELENRTMHIRQLEKGERPV
ncbi:MAG: hypothetical protein K0R57_1570 [Paenibacillaceae bacterium]|jgi:spore germination protein PE|nr:hypothetical protein [Paenibacillaceae bacterium]